jgi:hypothetical protein
VIYACYTILLLDPLDIPLGCRHLSPASTPASTSCETSYALQVLPKGPVVRFLLVRCCSVEPWVCPCAKNMHTWHHAILLAIFAKPSLNISSKKPFY